MLDQIPTLASLLALASVNQVFLPAPLDLIMLGLFKAGLSPFLIIVFATIGLTLGATIDYCIAKFGIETIPWLKKKTNTKSYHHAERFYKKYGLWTLLFTFLPFVGKYFPFIAGLMEAPLKKVLSVYILGKILYYGTLIFAINLIGSFIL